MERLLWWLGCYLRQRQLPSALCDFRVLLPESNLGFQLQRSWDDSGRWWRRCLGLTTVQKRCISFLSAFILSFMVWRPEDTHEFRLPYVLTGACDRVFWGG